MTTAHFHQTETKTTQPAKGEVLLRTVLMSIDAANRAWMQGPTYRTAMRAGDAIATYAICAVVDRADPSVLKGDIVMAETCWADYSTLSARKVSKPFSDGAFSGPLSHFLSVYGIAGKTAYHGLIGVEQAKAGDTIVVSAAAGSVGGLVGQIAKALGCHVVGIAGGVDKCAWVTDTLGFDHCVDYRADGLFKAIKCACPAGVDLYFDNVGGRVLETTLAVMNPPWQGGVIRCDQPI